MLCSGLNRMDVLNRSAILYGMAVGLAIRLTDRERSLRRTGAGLPESAGCAPKAPDRPPVAAAPGHRPPANASPFSGSSGADSGIAPSAPFPRHQGFPDSCGHDSGTAFPAGAHPQTAPPAPPAFLPAAKSAS